MSSDDALSAAKQVQALARVMDAASATILGYLVDNPADPDAQLLRQLMRDLDRLAAQLDAEALRIMGAVNDESLKALQTATASTEAFAKRTAEIKKGLTVFARVLNLAAALTGGADPLAIAKAAKAVNAATKPPEDEKAKGGKEKAASAKRP